MQTPLPKRKLAIKNDAVYRKKKTIRRKQRRMNDKQDKFKKKMLLQMAMGETVCENNGGLT
jgi:hypothetical protein